MDRPGRRRRVIAGVQHVRLDSRQAEPALPPTIAYRAGGRAA